MPKNEAAVYHRVKQGLFFFNFCLNLAALIFFFTSGWSAKLRDFAFNVWDQPVAAYALYVVIFIFGLSLLQFPADFFEGFVWEHRFRLSRQTWKDWLIDEVKKGLLGGALALIAIETVYFFLRRFPESWWIWAAVFWFMVSLVLTKILPNIIIPIFYKYSDIEDAELKSKVRALFERYHIKLKDAYKIDFSRKTKKANAFICGMGKTRRIVLSDTLLAEFSVPEIEAVVAHEIAHYKHGDIGKLAIINAVMMFGGFFLLDGLLKYLTGSGSARIDDIAFLPVLLMALTVLGLIITPLMNAYSRAIEVRADAFSLQATRNKEAFISMMRKLGEMNLSQSEPGRLTEIFFYDHPSIGRRIRFAEQWPGEPSGDVSPAGNPLNPLSLKK